MFQSNYTRVMMAIILVSCFALSYGIATAPDAPGGGAMACLNCPCVQLEYWWTNGDASSPQCKYSGTPLTLTTHGKATVKSDVCTAGALTTPGPTVTRYDSPLTKRVCTGAAAGDTEKIVPKAGNVNTSTTSTETRALCGGEQ
jgi:hypothetical protein